MKKINNNVLLAAIPFLVVLAGIFIIYTAVISNTNDQTNNHGTGIENNTYLRVMTCIASVNPTKRTPDYVKLCYAEAEKHNGIEVTRFGDGK